MRVVYGDRDCPRCEGSGTVGGTRTSPPEVCPCVDAREELEDALEEEDEDEDPWDWIHALGDRVSEWDAQARPL